MVLFDKYIYVIRVIGAGKILSSLSIHFLIICRMIIRQLIYRYTYEVQGKVTKVHAGSGTGHVVLQKKAILYLIILRVPSGRAAYRPLARVLRGTREGTRAP